MEERQKCRSSCFLGAGNSINPACASRFVKTTLYKANKNVNHKQKEHVI